MLLLLLTNTSKCISVELLFHSFDSQLWQGLSPLSPLEVLTSPPAALLQAGFVVSAMASPAGFPTKRAVTVILTLCVIPQHHMEELG